MPATQTIRSHPLISGCPPAWASAWGQDQYGLWLAFRLGEAEQRLRWIPPGRFTMGSPKSEAGRFGDETPHQVTLTHGFWLFDTPVTQALWTAVMSKNPSRFKGPQRPVEQVSWDDCQNFIAKINQHIPGLSLRLPTEAEWEYACRAGTTTATYARDSKNERETLDEIAWYSGNSNSETHAVAQKRPNGWGLYDMLGNVWEWCSDWYGSYSGKEKNDPTGPESGAYRVYRGGSWGDGARFVRAAYRSHWPPGVRYDYLGFRCARGQEAAGRAGGGAPTPAQAEPAGGRTGEAILAAAPGSAVSAVRGLVEAGNGVSFALAGAKNQRLQTDAGMLTLRQMTRPPWAEAIGRDRHGLWLTFRFGEAEQRMRYIPPGRFTMGSPKTEAGRSDKETPHRVTLTQGFWLFDTPVTQALWTAVMGDNPSSFKHPQRPVESMNWDDCQKFIAKINGEKPGLALRLPTEAEWEYACRAGTSTATYAGDLEIKGVHNAPVLDAIAWYSGNSGVDFELDNGWDSSDWKEKQHDHKRAGSHPVAQKAPNAWGLYDMLGNVWEWCADWYGDYSVEDEIDPAGPEKGADRVYRGGCWSFDARLVRAAYRRHWHPDYRNVHLGFRCARPVK